MQRKHWLKPAVCSKRTRKEAVQEDRKLLFFFKTENFFLTPPPLQPNLKTENFKIIVLLQSNTTRKPWPYLNPHWKRLPPSSHCNKETPLLECCWRRPSRELGLSTFLIGSDTTSLPHSISRGVSYLYIMQYLEQPLKNCTKRYILK